MKLTKSTMHSVHLFLLASLLFFITDVSRADKVPLEVFGHLPSIEDVAISPDGSRIAVVKTTGDERLIHVASLIEHKALADLHIGNNKLRQIIWADNEHILFIVSTSKQPHAVYGENHEYYLLFSYDLVTKKLLNPLRNVVPESGSAIDINAVTTNSITGEPMLRRIDGHIVVYVSGRGTDVNRIFKPLLLKFNLEADLAKIVARSTELDNSWLIDQNGVVVANLIYSEEKHRWTLSLRLDGHIQSIASGDALIEHPEIIGFAPTVDAIWMYDFDDDNGDPILKSVSLKDGAISNALPQNGRYEQLLTDKFSGRVIAGKSSNGQHDLEFFDSRMQEVWSVINASFPNEHVEFVSASDDLKKWVVNVEGKSHGYLYLLFDADTYKFASLGSVYERLQTIAEVKAYNYHAADGMNIPGFLTLPERAAKNLPLIVLPHGGPAAHDDGHFDWMAQAFAAQGYAVLQPNFRGSDLNWNFMSAGFGEWGRKMQTDLSDGVRQLVKEGVVDAKRVCIVGASYGGYAALAGATLDLGNYRCAVSVAGISDLNEMRDLISKRNWREDSRSGRYFDRYLGAKESDDPVLKERSPVDHVDKADIPILLIHGKDDTVVPYEQSQLMYDALKKANKEVEFVTLKHEDHWLSNSDTRMQMLQATVDFLLKNNPPN